MTKSVFVTVGTTRFDELVQSATCRTALDWMQCNGYTKLVVQYGSGPPPTVSSDDFGIILKAFKFKASLEEDMKKADLVLSHGGAGTIMEALKLRCHLVVVTNPHLMDNHQRELADALGSRNHLQVIHSPQQLHDHSTWKRLLNFHPKPHMAGSASDFSGLIDSFLGYSTVCKEE